MITLTSVFMLWFMCVLVRVPVCGGQRLTLGIFLDCAPPYFLRQGFH